MVFIRSQTKIRKNSIPKNSSESTVSESTVNKSISKQKTDVTQAFEQIPEIMKDSEREGKNNNREINHNNTHLKQFLDHKHIAAIRAANAAVINISGRQRMLCQRVALFALRFVTTSSINEQESLRNKLKNTLCVLQESHNALISGNHNLNNLEILSPEMHNIYFAPPLNLNQKILNFIHTGQSLADAEQSELTLENPDLQYLLDAAETSLLNALDQAVTQYQIEKEEQDRNIEKQQNKLYQDICQAKALAEAKTQELQNTLTELQETQVQLIQAEKLSSLGQLVAGISHEIKNPIQFIGGNLHYALEYSRSLLDFISLQSKYVTQPVPEAIVNQAEEIELDFIQKDLPKLLNSMSTGIDRIEEIIANLQNFSRLESSHQKSVDIHDNIETTLLLLTHRFKHQKRPIELIKEYRPIPTILGYSGLLSQVFMNLLGNAIDVLESADIESPQIGICTETVSDRIVIKIRDNGLGMDEDTQNNLFTPFFTTKPVGKGTGLGLSISHQIITERYQGRLTCESKLGEGTVFRIELPVKVGGYSHRQ